MKQKTLSSPSSKKRKGSEDPNSGSKSKETETIEILFTRFWPKGVGEPAERPIIVTNNDIVAAIVERNCRHPEETKPLSTKNPANFLKDFRFANLAATAIGLTD